MDPINPNLYPSYSSADRRSSVFCCFPRSRSRRSGSGPQRRRGSPRLGGVVSGSPSRLSPVASRPRLRPPRTGRRPCVRTSLSPPASAVPWEPGQLPRVAGPWLRRCICSPMFFAGPAPDPTVLMHCESWPGLPRGVEFNPSDSDILWHLAAEVGNGRTERHPFIHEFIKFVDGDGGFYCRHPQDIPGVRQDGRASYFFHRSFEPCNNENDASNCWKKIGSPRSIILDGTLQGCKEVFALYADMTSDKSSQETDWRLHQYHLQNTVKAESEIVVSKIFLASRNNLCELAEEGRIESEQYVSTHKGSSVECAKGFNFEICTEIDELDHIPLKERYRILLADKSSGLGTVSTGKSIMCVETSRSSPRRNHEGTTHKEDICSMLQEISSAPPIIESNPMDDNSNMTLLGEDLPVEGSENQIDGTATCMSENSELVARKQGAHLADVKLEPALEGYKIGPSESPQANSTHAKGSVPSLGVKDELTDCELPEKVSFSSRQRRKRKTSCSTEKMLEEDADTVKEGVAYRSRRRRKKTATDSIEKALDEDAPGLLQILLNRGIGVEEIKLYGAEEDNEMIEDSTESNFEDLENVIANIFPKKGKGYLLSVSRYERGEKAIYCLSCLISLIEQSRYLQFRDCPVEWGWCRDLQSFIFVFTSHNRIVLERPEYGYATYFFEVVQSTPIEWQIRRLVVAMKLSGCGRTALIENRPLMVGEDLTEGEAHVLEEYGWVRNTGLGTMVNYRDRVVHDRWTEKCVADWRAKIGKLLMVGYAEGQSVTTHGPKKIVDLLEATGDAELEIKLEDPY